MQILRGRTDGIRQLAISPDGSTLVAGGSPIHTWDLNNPKSKPRRISVGERGSWGDEFQFLSATRVLVRTHQPERWYGYDLDSGEVTELAPNHDESKEDACIHRPSALLKGSVKSSPWSPLRVATYRVTADGLTLLPTPEGATPVRRLSGFTPCGQRYLAEVAGANFMTASRQLFDATADDKVTTFDATPRNPFWRMQGWCFAPDSRQLFVVTDFQLLRYDCATGGRPTAEADISERDVKVPPRIAAHPDGRLLATVEDGRAVTFRDAETLEVLRTYDFAMPTVTCVAFTPDGTRCVIGNSRGKVLLFDVD